MLHHFTGGQTAGACVLLAVSTRGLLNLLHSASQLGALVTASVSVLVDPLLTLFFLTQPGAFPKIKSVNRD